MKKTCVGIILAAVTMSGLALPAVAQKEAEGQKQAEPAATKKLMAGDPAPKLEVEKFVKGNAVTGFEKGKVYVVEFWATWCGPCVKAFPHLSELQAKHKDKVTFVGVNIWERGYSDETLAKIESFVKDQGDKMAYTVAYDGKGKKTDKAYMQAAGRNGIPTAFVVDGESKVAWIGHPMQLDSVLDDVLAGKWDTKKARKEAEEAAAAEAKREAAMEKAEPIIAKMREAMGSEEWENAIKAMDELKGIDGEVFGQVDMTKFDVLLTKMNQPEKAYAMKDALLANKTVMGNQMMLNQIAWSVVDPDGEVKNGNADFALAFATKADELAKGKDPAIADTLARCYWAKGDKAKAIEVQERAVQLCGKDEQYEEMKGDLEKTLKEYKDKK